MQFDKKNVPLPLQRKHIKRITEEIEKMEVGQSFICDYPTAQAFKMFSKYHGWESCQQKIDDSKIRCWRVK